jgi:hypothetical protein
VLVDYETKIVSVGQAAREFLTIVIGLALAYALATRAPLFEGIEEGNVSLSPQVKALFVYIVYASRFYVNNWIYLAESYNEATIKKKQLNEKKKEGRRLLSRVYTDLLLTIYTALIISIVPLFSLSKPAIYAKVAIWLTWCLIAHYVADAVALAVTTVSSGQTTPLNRIRSSLWIMNNVSFALLFGIGLWIYDQMEFNWLLNMLLLNCVIAIAITLVTPLLVNLQEIRRSRTDVRASAGE